MINVLVVDDSRLFRNMLRNMLESDRDINVIAQASDGEQAVQMVEQYKPDVITMDVEMPKMDGITAVKKIMAKRPTPIMMFSNLTEQGAKTTLEALHAGAADFQSKNFRQHSIQQEQIIEKLHTRIKALVYENRTSVNETTEVKTNELKRTIVSKAIEKKSSTVVKISNYELIAIGASTGGPVALEKVMSMLPASFPTPIIIVQHMPEMFTIAFAERLDNLCNIHVKEAEDGDALLPGTAYLAPGGMQTCVKTSNSKKILSVGNAAQDMIYKPCVDETFKSVAKAYPRGKTLAIVMTGMGSDGCEGARMLKRTGATVWAQDKTSCVVYGMPMAVANENLADKILAVDDIGISLSKTA